MSTEILFSADPDEQSPATDFSDLPSHAQLKAALEAARAADKAASHLADGAAASMQIVCAVNPLSEDRRRMQAASQAVSARNARSASALSLPGLALSTSGLLAKCSRTAAVRACRRAVDERHAGLARGERH